MDQSFKNFLDTVEAMRRAQKQYFKTRKEADLVEAKRLEAAVDVRVGSLRREIELEGNR